jgi:predicted nucleic acid-binding protein
MNNLVIIADSSFYICFLDDIKKPAFLIHLLKFERFRFTIGPIIKGEINKSPNYPAIEIEIKSHVRVFEYYSYGEILKPVFSIEEMIKGEHEVVAIAYILNFLNIDFIAILDEERTKNFVQNSFPKISTKFVGTIGFIEICCCHHKIFSKLEGIAILDSIRNSKFRVDNRLIDKIIEKIRLS